VASASTAQCAYCGTEVVDYSSVIDLPSAIYCCRNCLAASRGGHNAIVPDVPLCEHCECPLIEPETLVERNAARFCCYNCAAAETRAARALAA
jgi:hypothetical protein